MVRNLAASVTGSGIAVRERQAVTLPVYGAKTPARAGVEPSFVLVVDDDDDLFLEDLRLPRQSGIEVLQMLRTAPSTARIPVIVLTGCPCGAAAVPIGDFQHVAFLGKPV